MFCPRSHKSLHGSLLPPAFLYSVTSHWSLGFRTAAEDGPVGESYAHLLRLYPETPFVRQVHARIIREGISRDSFFATHLVKSYAKAGSFEAARQVFELVPEQSVFLFNAIIRAYSIKESWSEIADLYPRMEKSRVEPDSFTLPFVIKAFSSLLLKEEGQRVRETAERMGLLDNVHVATALIDMHLKFDELDPAMEVFDKMPERDVVSCTSMVMGCVRIGKYKHAFRIFRMMQLGDHKPNWVTVLGLLPACDYSIHGFVIKSGFHLWVEVQTALLDVYAKYGNIVLARKIFDQIQQKSLVTWTAMVRAYSQNNYIHEALGIFCQMQRSSEFRPDAIIAASVLQACAQLGSFYHGEMVHGCILRSGFASDLLAETALLDMYAKCGSIIAAETVFNGMQDSSMISWSAMIAGYGFHGLGLEALNLFHKMIRVGFVPDESSFLSVLSACSHSGLVSEGEECFELMLQSNYVVTPNTKHYACMVDLFGRAGLLDEASALVEGMLVEPDVNVWGALLSATRGTRRVDLAELACQKLIELDPENTDYHVLLANFYAGCGRWQDVSKVRAIIRQKSDGKMPGWSLIEVNSKLHAFLAEDGSHPEANDIYPILLTIHEIARERDVRLLDDHPH